MHRFVPSHFQDPVGLAKRLIRSRNDAAWFAMESAFLGLLLTPLDMLLQIAEKRRYCNAPKPKRPLILVCGAPRSGTTLVAQALISHLPVCYFNNLTSVFPRAPIVANLLFGNPIGPKTLDYDSYYGKSVSFSGPNDALYIWDRWLGKDRTSIPTALSQSAKEQLSKFFGAYEQAFERPIVGKNNSLNTCAHLIAEVLDSAHFLCMARHPVYLAQSLLKARTDIHGDPNTVYGVFTTTKANDRKTDYIEDVCEQVFFYEQKIKEQQTIIGPERFWIVSYETFCEKPEQLVKKVSEQILHQPIRAETVAQTLKPFHIHNKITLQRELFHKIESTLARMRQQHNPSVERVVPF